MGVAYPIPEKESRKIFIERSSVAIPDTGTATPLGRNAARGRGARARRWAGRGCRRRTLAGRGCRRSWTTDRWTTDRWALPGPQRSYVDSNSYL